MMLESNQLAPDFEAMLIHSRSREVERKAVQTVCHLVETQLYPLLAL